MNSILDGLLGAGLEAFEEQAPAVTPVPSIDVAICEEEVAVVEAATEAVQAEVVLLASAEAVVETDALVDAQTTLVQETADVVASMESFIGSPMSKQDALALQLRVIQATQGQYGKERIVGSLESFGTDIATDDALNAGLEGMGEFLAAAKNKLSNLVSVMRQRVSGFFKDAFVNFDKVAKRSAAVQRLAKNTSGESNSSAIQLQLDTALHLVKDGKLVPNLGTVVSELSKAAEAVMRANNVALADHRKKFIELVNPLATADIEAARDIAKKIADWRLPKPGYATSKIQTSSRTLDLFRGDVLPGDEALFVTVPANVDVGSGLSARLEAACDAAWGNGVELKDTAKKPNKLDLAVDTLKPAEMVKITETIDAILGDIKTYSKTWGAWDEANSELDRLMGILANVRWEGDAAEYEGSYGGADGEAYVMTSTMNMRLADTIYYINSAYGYMSTQPTLLMAKKLIVVMNRVLEVCERSLATYSDNNLR